MKKFFNIILAHPISTNLLILIIAAYQATLLNIAYYKHVLSKLPLDSLNNILFFLSMPLVIFCVIFALLNITMNKWLIKTIASLFMIIGASLSYFMMKFSIVIDKGMLQNALETNSAESAALITPTLVGYVIILGIIPTILLWLVRIKPAKNTFHFIFMRLFSIIGSLLIIGLMALIFYKDYAAFMRNNNKIIKYLLPSNYISAAYSQYQFEKYKDLPFLTIGADAYQNKQQDTNNKKTVMVLVVGETARSQNFSLNGYTKETNPLLAKRDNVISFADVSSCGTYTAYSVPCMFSNMTRKTYDEIQAYRQENVLDILNRVKIEVTWFDNDSGCKGVCDRITSESLTKKYISQASALCKDGECYDEVLLNSLSEKMANIDKDSLIVLHTIGSHGPTYYQRYPEQFKKFTPTCDTNQINNCDAISLTNTYDNTIVYTDYIVDQTISILEKYQDKYNTMVVYLSDHGESLGENGVYLHSLPYAIAPAQQTQVPFIMWMSKGLQQQDHIDYTCLKTEAKQDTFSQDYLFHTLLGIFDINTKEYNRTLDMLNRCQINQTQVKL